MAADLEELADWLADMVSGRPECENVLEPVENLRTDGGFTFEAQLGDDWVEFEVRPRS